MQKETWKPVTGFEEGYQVSDLGRVKSINYNRTRKEKILKPSICLNGYCKVVLCKDGKIHHKRVHRLVAEAFVDNPNLSPEVDHINTDRLDNRADNLRWVSHRENKNNPLSILNSSKAHKGKGKKPVSQFSKDGKLIKEWPSALDAGKRLGIAQQSICSCCRGRRITAGGFIWKFNINYL